MSPSNASRLLGIFASALCAPAVVAQSGLLDPVWGEHPVGFQSSWQMDFGREYRCRTDQGSAYGRDRRMPRPILVNIWYPAHEGGSPMRHAEYFAIESPEAELAPLARAIKNHAQRIAREELRPAGMGEAKFEEAMRRALDAPAKCVRGAKPLDGPFPIVLYHSGHGSSFEDNAGACELLASHGYVVLGSAYQKGDGATLNVDAGESSIGDFRFLLSYAHGSLPNADLQHVGFIGHSGGAHVGFRYCSTPDTAVDAFVSLDTTQDYYSLGVRFWENYVPATLERADQLDIPVLVVAGSHAIFRFADRLSSCERTYLLLPALGHNEYISQGVAHAVLAGKGAETEDVDDVLERYGAINAFVVAFLDAKLKGASTTLDRLCGEWGEPRLGWESPRVVRVPVGTTDAAPVDPTTADVPGAREMFRFMLGASAEDVAAVVQRFGADAAAPYLGLEFFVSISMDLIALGRGDDARALYEKCFRVAKPGLVSDLLSLADRTPLKEYAVEILDILEVVALNDEAIQREVRAVRTRRGF